MNRLTNIQGSSLSEASGNSFYIFYWKQHPSINTVLTAGQQHQQQQQQQQQNILNYKFGHT